MSTQFVRSRCTRTFPLLLAVLCAGLPAWVAAAEGPVTRAEGLPGVWIGAGFGSTPWRNTTWTPTPELTEWGAAESRRLASPDLEISYCEPGVAAGMMTANPLFPMQIAAAPGELIVMMEGSAIQRHIYLDGRAHPESPEPKWMGHSVGRWEGEVLVVDTIGFKPSLRPLNGFVSNAVIPLPTDAGPRLPLSEKLRMIERIRLVGDGEFLENEITLDDPKVYQRPFTFKVYSQRRPDLSLEEYYCGENPRPGAEGGAP